MATETAVANQGNGRQLLFHEDCDYQRMLDRLIDSYEASLRAMANSVYWSINEGGDG